MTLSGFNPLKNNINIQKQITNFNAHSQGFYKAKELDQKINAFVTEVVKATPKPEYRDEATRLVKHEGIRLKLREKLKLLKKGDIVCDKSQGLFFTKNKQGKEITGRTACASISANAVYRLLGGVAIDSQKKMYDIIKKGVDDYVKAGFQGTLMFEQVFKRFNDDLKRQGLIPLKIVVPKKIKDVQPFFIDMISKNPLELPFQGALGDGFSNYLTALRELVKEKGLGMCAVITAKGETIVAYMDHLGSPKVFDSHGRTYMGVPKGASLLSFKNIKETDDHLKKIFNANKSPKDPCNVIFVGLDIS